MSKLSASQPLSARLPPNWYAHPEFTNCWQYRPEGDVVATLDYGHYCDPPYRARRASGEERRFDWAGAAVAWCEEVVAPVVSEAAAVFTSVEQVLAAVDAEIDGRVRVLRARARKQILAVEAEVADGLWGPDAVDAFVAGLVWPEAGGEDAT